MKKILYLLSIGLMVTLLGCGSTTATKEMPIPAPATKVTTPAPTPTPAPAPVEEKWVAVKSWTGTGIKKTENFEITGSDWRVNWKSDGKNGNNSIFALSPYKKDGSPLAPLASTLGSGADVSYVHEGAGTYYLSINAANTSWTVSVEEQK